MLSAKALLDREYLEMRCRLVDLAASLDRIGRGEGADTVGADPRMRLISEAAALLVDGKPDRARRMQMHFSDAYRAGWRDEFAMTNPG